MYTEQVTTGKATQRARFNIWSATFTKEQRAELASAGQLTHDNVAFHAWCKDRDAARFRHPLTYRSARAMRRTMVTA